MSSDHTQHQSSEEQREAQKRSLTRSKPPTQVPGYEIKRFLGSGAYGEVWVGLDQNTGRRVAIKFYTHRGGVDWSLLSQEVEKLVFLSADRYVVQLLDVGWNADPPYYVMDYIENGSLEDLLTVKGPLSVAESVELFHEIVVGLMHLHGKGVLHCDLKPANVLLDNDHKPRLADFGQSRLSHEQSPALGTLFYMAPEQADMEAVPDARWDVYALGALLYCMLTGEPPHRSDHAISQIDSATDLADRLARYRAAIRSAPLASKHRKVPHIDRHLIEIIDRCLAVDPESRFHSVQSVLEALDQRNLARARRPLTVLGVVGPLLLLLVMGLFSWRGYRGAMHDSQERAKIGAQAHARPEADSIASQVADQINGYFFAVERVELDPEFKRLFQKTIKDQELADLRKQLNDPNDDSSQAEMVRRQFRGHATAMELQQYINQLLDNERLPQTASWFVCDQWGTQIAAVFDSENTRTTVGYNYSWRTYFHEGDSDLRDKQNADRYLRPPEGQHLTKTHLSAAFESTASGTWKIAVSTPILIDGEFQGIVALTVDIGKFMEFTQTDRVFSVLVDGRDGDNRGVILQHPLFNTLIGKHNKLPPSFGSERKYRVQLDDAALSRENGNAVRFYVDTLSRTPEGASYRKNWIAAKAPVRLNVQREKVDSGLVVLVQEDYEPAFEPVRQLGKRLIREGAFAFGGVICVVFVLWYFVVRMLSEPRLERLRAAVAGNDPTPLHQMETIAAPDHLKP